MKLDCFPIGDTGIDIRPSSNRREWMDGTDEKFAYRCLPLSIANSHGWVICCDAEFEAEWNGGEAAQDVQVVSPGEGEAAAEGPFGYGILTFSPNAMFRTDPGYNLWVTGPPNSFKDGIQALSAVIEADWMPYSFSMNWKFTRPGHRIRFEKGEPYCFLFPIKRGVPDAMEPRLRDLAEDPENARMVEYGRKMRFFLRNVRSMEAEKGEDARILNEKALNYQMWYMKGRLPDGSGAFEGHQKHLDLRPFADLRTRRPNPESREAGEGLQL